METNHRGVSVQQRQSLFYSARIIFWACLTVNIFGVNIDQMEEIINNTYSAIIQKNYWMIAGVALSLLTLALRSKIGFIGKIFKGDRGGVALVALLAIFGGLAHALLAGEKPGVEALAATVKAFMTAVTAYVVSKRVAAPKQ